MSDIGAFVNLDDDLFLGTSEKMDVVKDEKVDSKIKIIKIIFFALCVILLGELVAYKFVMPSLSSPTVSVNGVKHFSADDIRNKLSAVDNTNWFTFDVNKAAAILSSEPVIESVVVEKHFPDKVTVDIKERERVALTFIIENGCSTALQIDKNGVLFPCTKETVFDSNIVPIISGLPVEYMAGGMRIPNKYKPLIDQISKIGGLPQKYFASIAEICVIPKEYGNYELALIPSQSHVRVLTDRALNEDSLKYMMVVLDVVNQLGSDVSEIDLRYGSVSYRTK